MAKWLAAASAAALSAGAALSQPETVPYCEDLRRVIALANTSQGFASISGSPGEGSFQDTTMPLPGWKDCPIYGEKTYACNSEVIDSAGVARERVASIVQQV